jgi:hypothetical protein
MNDKNNDNNSDGDHLWRVEQDAYAASAAAVAVAAADAAVAASRRRRRRALETAAVAAALPPRFLPCGDLRVSGRKLQLSLSGAADDDRNQVNARLFTLCCVI